MLGPCGDAFGSEEASRRARTWLENGDTNQEKKGAPEKAKNADLAFTRSCTDPCRRGRTIIPGVPTTPQVLHFVLAELCFVANRRYSILYS